MKSLKETTTLAFAALACFLASCSGGGGGSSAALPATGPAKTGVNAPSNSVSGSATIRRSQQLTNGANTANSVTAYVVSSSVNVPMYNPVSSCVNLPAPGSSTGTNLQFPLPPGLDFVMFVSTTGSCVNSSTTATTLPTAVQLIVTNNSKTFTAPSTLGSLPVVGSYGAGTVVTQNTFGAAQVNAGVIPAGLVAYVLNLGLGVGVTNTAATLKANLSPTASPAVTSFVMDPASAVNILPINLTLTDASASPGVALPASGFPTTTSNFNATDTPITVTVTDTTPNATIGHLKIGIVGPGTTAPNDLVLPIATAVQASGAVSATLTYGSGATSANLAPAGCGNLCYIPPAGSFIYITYDGSNQDTFATGTVVVKYQNQQIGSTIALSSQPQIVTLAAVAGAPPAGAGLVPGPLGITNVGDPTVAGSVLVTDGKGVYAGTAATPGFNAGGANGITWAAVDNAGTATVIFSAISTAGAAGNIAGAVDYTNSGSVINVAGTTNGVLGLWTRANNAAGLTQVSGNTNAAGTGQLVGQSSPPYPAGPVGIAYTVQNLNSGGGGTNCNGTTAASGAFYVAGVNGIYRVDMNSATTFCAVTLLAGSGTIGGGGAGNVDNANGLNARFNFGTSKLVGLALDYNPEAAITATNTPANLYVCDTGNNTIRKVALSGTNAVSTVGTVSPAMTGQGPNCGLTYDATGKTLYLTNSTGNTIQSIGTAGTAATLATTFAGTAAAGTSDGLTIATYPVQFVTGNATTGTAATAAVVGAPGAPWSKLTTPPTGNSDQTQEAKAGVASFLGSLTNPASIIWEGTKSFFYLVDNPTASAPAAPSVRALP